jgi:DNA-binding NarL/FixJ family response regulator
MSNPLHPARTLLVVDDHPLVRDALAGVLTAPDTGWRCHAASSAAQALRHLASGIPYAAVLADYRLPDGDGFDVLAHARAVLPQAACALMSGVDDAALIARARQARLAGYLSKSLEPAQIVAAVHTLLAGGRVFPEPDPDAAPGIHLSPRQTEVLQRVCSGLSSKEIGRELGLTERTVKDHLSLAYARLGVSSRAEAVARAAALGLIALGR